MAATVATTHRHLPILPVGFDVGKCEVGPSFLQSFPILVFRAAARECKRYTQSDTIYQNSESVARRRIFVPREHRWAFQNTTIK